MIFCFKADAKYRSKFWYPHLVKSVQCFGYECFNPGMVKTINKVKIRNTNLFAVTEYDNVLHRKCLYMHDNGCPDVCVFYKKLFEKRVKQENWRWFLV